MVTPLENQCHRQVYICTQIKSILILILFNEIFQKFKTYDLNLSATQCKSQAHGFAVTPVSVASMQQRHLADHFPAPLYLRTIQALDYRAWCTTVYRRLNTRIRASHELGGFWFFLVTQFFYGQTKTNTGTVSRPMSSGFSW